LFQKELVAVSAKNRVEVRICGKDYTLIGVESDEYMQRVALYIDEKMNEITRVNSKLSTTMAAVLTAVNVADDFFKTREIGSTFEKELKQLQNDFDRLKKDNERLNEENSFLGDRNTNLQLELAKREAELSEVRSSFEKASKLRELNVSGI
jgi:cell division protein ZapA